LCVEQCNQKLTLGNLVELRKKSALEKAENPEREPKEMTMTFSRLKEGIQMFQAGSRMLEDTASKVQVSGTTIHGIMKLFACIVEVLKRANKPFSFHTSVLCSFKSSLGGTRIYPPACLEIEDGDPNNLQIYES
jgi:hypothetical protein